MQIPHSTRIPLKVKFDSLQILVDQGNTCGCYRHFKLVIKLFPVSCLEKQDVSMAEGYHEQKVWAGAVESLLFKTTLFILHVFVSLDWQPLPLLPEAAPSAPPEPFP